MSKPRSKNQQEIHGILLLNKPQGISSNAALQKARNIFRAKKAGHTGSLDPMATGLLPCCFGDATRIAGLMLSSDKIYIAECEISRETDTGDATGTVTQESSKHFLQDEEIEKGIQNFSGEIEQIPPMYSALYHNGVRLYKLARSGVEVERPSRKITIHDFKLLNIDNSSDRQKLSFEIHVSKGTYIRTLLEDFAKYCGTYAHMTKLHRIQTGVLKGKMVTLEQLQEAENPFELLNGIDYALTEYPQVTLTKEQIQTLIHGLRFESKMVEGIYRIYDEQSQFIGLGEAQSNGQFKVKKLFLKSYLG